MSRMNIAATLFEQFEQFDNNEIINSMQSLSPSEQFSILSVTMEIGGRDCTPIRHVPIIEPTDPKKPNIGELKALISELDVASLSLPRWELIPKEVVNGGLINISKLTNDVLSLTRKTIREAFPELFLGTPPKAILTDSLGSVITKFTDVQSFNEGGGTKTRRYKTIPVFDATHTLVGMLSYVDIFREILKNSEGHDVFLKKTVKEVLKEINQKKDDIKTIDSTFSIFDATRLFKSVSFTHLPVETNGYVTGLIDDVIVNTYQHPSLISAFAKVPLSRIAVPISTDKVDKIFVDSDANLLTVINRFLLKDRPTALLIGKMDTDKFVMDGIISYLDILRNFEKTFLLASDTGRTLG